ncbi:MAG: 30S ribosomal protein S4 [Candidatus Sungiibacteriota bacterium]|uniref:Small ribosomal subunit protein uS4 n=1 Tax=Candidatus Sungiibacteriota bacterium TaxID=2750080 RepID=A0A7T5UQE5_9BACT|nr:MAG: 30S ribosomal protein S4 [Candidatus Sungbacteria bacterium]
MVHVLEKKERRLGEKLLLKGDRCSGPKCALIRRGYPPGIHGKKKGRRRGSSEYKQLLNEKQKIRFLYGLDDRDMEQYSKKAASRSGIFSSNLTRLLERRLDNTVFRLGLAVSRHNARQLVGHGHVLVNSKTVNIPSFQVKKDDLISLKESSLKSDLFRDLEMRLKKYEAPAWLSLDKNKKVGKVVGLPENENVGAVADITKIKEFYSR